MNSITAKINSQEARRAQTRGWEVRGGTRRQVRAGAEGGDLQSEDNQGCQHCSLHQPKGAIATTERRASRREEGMEIQSTLLAVTT